MTVFGLVISSMITRHCIKTQYTYYKPENCSHRPLCSHLRPRCSHLHAEGRNEARCLADGVRGHSHTLGLDCYSAASSDHTLAACGAVGAAVASGVRSEYTQSAPPFARSHSHCGDKRTTRSRLDSIRKCATSETGPLLTVVRPTSPAIDYWGVRS